ncbi:unnamed protein product [Chrysodeixis includens]|uniref:Uncharacterized protein n=1 Tax=Chrysodeixis includens TaxID=689277 RepID=A0A9P0FUD5_CHRIL|nr:unnamed protein product [Chrysodeixis includens]
MTVTKTTYLNIYLIINIQKSKPRGYFPSASFVAQARHLGPVRARLQISVDSAPAHTRGHSVAAYTNLLIAICTTLYNSDNMKVLVVLSLSVVCVFAKVTPDYFPKCKRSDPQLDKCVLDAIENMRPFIKQGIPEVNIPPLDPFTVPTLKLDRTAPNLRLKATVKHAKAYGGSDFKIEKLKFNLNNKYVGEIKLVLPKLMVTANYDVKGSRLLTLDINGKGRLLGNFTGVTVHAKGSAKPITKDGVEYLQADKIITKVRINNAQVEFADTERPLAGKYSNNDKPAYIRPTAGHRRLPV